MPAHLIEISDDAEGGLDSGHNSNQSLASLMEDCGYINIPIPDNQPLVPINPGNWPIQTMARLKRNWCKILLCVILLLIIAIVLIAVNFSLDEERFEEKTELACQEVLNTVESAKKYLEDNMWGASLSLLPIQLRVQLSNVIIEAKCSISDNFIVTECCNYP